LPCSKIASIRLSDLCLALKYHPDRNPGKEAEVNAKFVQIQSAHEILINDEQKSKYDAHKIRTANRYPTASGVKGNPWQNVGKQYPVPPKRASMPPRTTSGANRYSSFNPPPAPTPASEDKEARYTAWNNMRSTRGRGPTAATAASAAKASNATRKADDANGAPKEPPKPPPRTASQRQRAEASFGARRTSNNFKASVSGDEPSTASGSYSTTKVHTNLFNDVSANARRPRRASSNAGTGSTNIFRDSFLDTRQSTPYQNPGGEKLNLFAGATNIGRAKSNRDNSRQNDDGLAPRREAQPRSSSAPGDPDDFSRSRTENTGR
jgi:curved DNA-binding protein CbpA